MYKSVKHKKMAYNVMVQFCLTMQKSLKHLKIGDQPIFKDDFFWFMANVIDQLKLPPILKFPHFFNSSMQAELAEISKLVDVKADPSHARGCVRNFDLRVPLLNSGSTLE